MAKHNIILGTATGSIGDITTMRREGVQVTRARVREIANPKTDGQAKQRNFLAPVAKFFAPLTVALEKSYEGLSKSKSYSAYLKKNIDLARLNGWYLPKGTPFFPLPYQVSRGSIKPLALSSDTITGGQAVIKTNIQSEVTDGTALTVAQISQAFINGGYNEGDQITVIFVLQTVAGAAIAESEWYPQYGRFFINTADTRALNTVVSGIMASVDNGDIYFKTTDGQSVLAGTVIVSRNTDGEWKRSTQSIVLAPALASFITAMSTSEMAIKSYQDGTNINLSDVYLNGQSSIVQVQNSAGKLVTIEEIVENGTWLNAYDEQRNEYYLQARGTSDNNGKFLQSLSAYSSNVPTDASLNNTIQFSLNGFANATASEQAMAAYMKASGAAASVFQ